MKVHHALERAIDRPLSLAIGFFDGMHRGHQEIAHAARRMRKAGWRVGVMSFANHPATFLRPGTEPPLLSTLEERVGLFADAGFEECFLVPFDASVSALTAEQFMDVLIARLGARAVAVGAGFRFGHRRGGDTQLLRDYLQARDVRVEAVEHVTHDGERISSTRIRTLIADGDLAQADQLLGHSYALTGEVQLGFGRGHDLGFPTANVRVPTKLLPKDGVYSAVARYDGRDYAALVSIGTNPQFDGAQRTVEAWLRDFHATIYGKSLTLRDLRFVRSQLVFDTIDALMDQMRKDLDSVAYPAFG